MPSTDETSVSSIFPVPAQPKNLRHDWFAVSSDLRQNMFVDAETNYKSVFHDFFLKGNAIVLRQHQ